MSKDQANRPMSPLYTFDSEGRTLRLDFVGTLSQTATPSTVEGLSSMFKDMSVFEDWSGRGSHVDFLPEEVLPLKKGKFLGHGSTGSVYETSIGDYTFAWKRRFCRHKITDVERREIEILKKLSHEHIIQLVGTYTHGQFLGLLLYPVAVCDLATFFEDYESICKGKVAAPAQQQRVEQLMLRSESPLEFKLSGTRYIRSKIGCLVSAVEYLHRQKIRHKDLKPSNILLAADELWLTDFGTATDFSLLSTTSTENCERGTPKYFAPEVEEFAPSGRAADIFSLGCVLLELCAVDAWSTLQPLRDLRPARDNSFHSNLNMIDHWFSAFAKSEPPRFRYLLLEIRNTLAKDPRKRPSATELRTHISLIDRFNTDSKNSLFGTCCSVPLIPVSEHEETMEAVKTGYQQNIQKIESERGSIVKALEARITEPEADKLKLVASANPAIIHTEKHTSIQADYRFYEEFAEPEPAPNDYEESLMEDYEFYDEFTEPEPLPDDYEEIIEPEPLPDDYEEFTEPEPTPDNYEEYTEPEPTPDDYEDSIEPEPTPNDYEESLMEDY